MSWLLFLDESGHDHKSLPYEVRGGIAIHASKLWAVVRELQRVEYAAFGTRLLQYGKELKGCKLLDKDRLRWASQGPRMEDEERQKLCRRFLTKGLEKKSPTRDEFTAYGQACLEIVRGMFQILQDHDTTIFAAAIPRDTKRPDTPEANSYLRKDIVYLLQRYFDFLESRQEHGLLVLDEVEKMEDRRFVRRLERYFTKTQTGRYRSAWIVPSPFFVASDMAYPVQLADMLIYCINWGFRLPTRGMDAETREEIASEFAPWINRLQFRGQGHRDGETFEEFGIVYVPDPYSGRQE